MGTRNGAFGKNILATQAPAGAGGSDTYVTQPGDAQILGNLFVGSRPATPPGAIIFVVRQGANGTREVINATSAGGSIILGDAQTGDVPISIQANPFMEFKMIGSGGSDPRWRYYNQGNNLVLALINAGRFSVYNGIATAGGGIPSFRGIDDRTAITAVDGSAITVYTVPATTGKMRISVTIVGRGGAITSAIYTYKYTVGGAVVTKTVSISAVDTDAENSLIVQPDASSAITSQVTTLTGTTPSVDVTCLVESVGANA